MQVLLAAEAAACCRRGLEFGLTPRLCSRTQGGQSMSSVVCERDMEKTQIVDH